MTEKTIQALMRLADAVANLTYGVTTVVGMDTAAETIAITQELKLALMDEPKEGERK